MSTFVSVVALLLPAPAPVTNDLPRVDRVRAHITVDRRWRVVRPYNAKLNRMAMCESSGRWHIATGNGFYGGLQFTVRSWRSVGGRGMPHWASVLEQKYRAVLLARRQGWGAWPVCQYA